MRILTVTDNQYGENCYIVLLNDFIYIIDPGIDIAAVKTVIERERLPVKAVFLTHGHYDHTISACSFGNTPIYAHATERELLEDPAINLSSYTGSPVSVKPVNYYNGETYSMDGFEFIHTPGHTAGCVVIKIDNSLFSGDTLFGDTVGRTDLPTGDSKILQKSLKLFDAFDKNLMVYPGHGEEFLLGDAYKQNYFLRKNL